jgi:hypothetical protein
MVGLLVEVGQKKAAIRFMVVVAAAGVAQVELAQLVQEVLVYLAATVAREKGQTLVYQVLHQGAAALALLQVQMVVMEPVVN